MFVKDDSIFKNILNYGHLHITAIVFEDLEDGTTTGIYISFDQFRPQVGHFPKSRISVTICHAADINYMRNTIQKHFSNIRHHATNPTYKELARTFIYQEFQRFGLDTEFHNFTTISNVKGSNIIGILKGKRFGTFNDRIAGIGAHYDTVRISPGVDDNGSGVAAMLEVAKRARTLDRHNTAIFVSFDLEEENYEGSAYFVEQWLPQFLATNYSADPLRYAYQMKLHGFYILDTIMEYNTSAHSQKFPPSLTPDTIKSPQKVCSGAVIDLQRIFTALVFCDLRHATFTQGERKWQENEISSSLVDHLYKILHLAKCTTFWAPGTFFSKIYNDLVADNFTGDYINIIYRKGEDESLNKALSRAWESFSDSVYQMESLQIPISDWAAISASDFGEFLRSDHANFWRKSLPSLFLTDSGDYRGDMIECYHHPCDNLKVMLTEDNLKFLGKQTDALYYSLLYLEKTDCGTPPNVVNTIYNTTEDSRSAIYECTKDTVLFPSKSNTTLTCTTSGEWSQVPFICVNRNVISGIDSLHDIRGCPYFLVLLMTMHLLLLV